jgi:hypothetical protein
VLAVHLGRELLDDDATGHVVALGVEQDVEAEGTAVSRHEPAVRVVQPELAGLGRPELEDAALDTLGLDLVEDRIRRDRYELARLRIGLGLRERVVVQAEEGGVRLALTRPKADVAAARALQWERQRWRCDCRERCGVDVLGSR